MFLRLNEPYQPLTLPLVSYGRKWCDEMYPRSTRMEWNEIILRVHEVHWTQKPGFLFPITICCGPIGLEDLSITK